MAEFLTTKGTSSNIEDIIIKAKSWLVLISPFLQLSVSLSKRLKDADSRAIKIVLVYGKDDLKQGEKQKLQQLKNLSLCFPNSLHAKCYFNEESMVIASMNMYEFSETNNREMGVLIKKSDDAKLFVDAVREAESFIRDAKLESGTQEITKILRNLITETQSEIDKRTSSSATREAVAVPKEVPKVKKDEPSVITKVVNVLEALTAVKKETSLPFVSQPTGYCIRCGTRMPQNPDYPLCSDCYKEWARYKNPDYEEQFCHICGRQALTTYSKPLCNRCYRASG
ncbi:MAG: phospholipase D-like domain-containing protein [Chloroflexota bacterium]